MANPGTEILGRVIRSGINDITPETASWLLELDFPKKDHARVARLSAKANEGRLTGDEREELEEYIRAAEMLALWQSKARLALRRQSRSNGVAK